MPWKERRLKGLSFYSIPLPTAVIALLLVAASWLAITEVEKSIQQVIGHSLITTRDTAHRSLHAWARDKRAATSILATSPEIMQTTRKLLALPPDRESLLASPHQEKLRSFMAATTRRRDYRGYFLLTRDNFVLSASRDIEIGAQSPIAGQRAVLNQLEAGQTLITLPFLYEVPLDDGSSVPTPAIFTGTSVCDRSGAIVAYLILRIDPLQEFSAIFNRGQIGRTGETYAFSRQGRMLNESRFELQLQQMGLLEPGQSSFLRTQIRDPEANLPADENSTLPRDRQPLTRMAQSAVRGLDGVDLEGYRNYRGRRVIGAWIGIRALSLGIATEMDMAEAYRPLRITRLILIVLTVFSLLLLFGLGLLFLIDQRNQRANQRKLQKANQELDAFVYTLCHDLRNHLTPIIGYADFLQDSGEGQMDRSTLDSLAQISTAGNRMLALMEDLLNLAKVGQIERPALPVNTREVVSGVVGSLNEQIIQAGAILEIGRLPNLRIPETLLTQIFHNLVVNAILYGCRPGGKIQIVGWRRGPMVRFYVRDHGVGIPPEERSRIFDVFYRGSAGERAPGTGIGLATVQKIAKVFGGRTWVEETPGGGSTFWVEMEDSMNMERK